MRRFVRDNSLTLVFLALFLVSLVVEAFVGHADFNHEQAAHQDETISLWRYATSSAYWVDVTENWQSEYLQFTLFVLGTVWLVQRGSPESKPIDKAGRESDQDQKLGEHAQPDSPRWAKGSGLKRTIYSNSLVLLMGTIWVLSWFAQLITGRVQYNDEQLDHHQAALSLVQYAGSSDFWNRTVQNWQSEFLAIASMVAFSIWLRQRGSPESKPVGEPHPSTGVEG